MLCDEWRQWHFVRKVGLRITSHNSGSPFPLPSDDAALLSDTGIKSCCGNLSLFRSAEQVKILGFGSSCVLVSER